MQHPVFLLDRPPQPRGEGEPIDRVVDPLAYTIEPPGAIFLIGTSRCRRSSRLVASVASCGNRLTPIEADVKNSTPPRSNGPSRASCPRRHRLRDQRRRLGPGELTDAAHRGPPAAGEVATLPRHEVGLPRAPAEPIGELLQELVTGMVT